MASRAWLCVTGVIVLLSNTGPSNATEGCLVDVCCSPVTTDGGVLLVCPAGDGPTLASIGATVSVTVLLCVECVSPIPWIPAEDFWIAPHNSASLALCNGYRSSDADAAGDENGHTTMSGSVAAGGYSSDVHLVAQGYALGYGCATDVPLPIILVSPDINADLSVNIQDIALFAQTWPPSSYDPRADLNGDSIIGVQDIALLAQHLGHQCE